jgi:hypothetical protein
MAFDVEEIPGQAKLFLRVHEQQYVTPADEPNVKRVSSACFRHENLSVNWEKYSSPKETAKPTSAVVVELVASECESLNQTVKHCPIQHGEKDGPNQAHSEIRGLKSKATQYRFVRISKIVWIRDHAPV